MATQYFKRFTENAQADLERGYSFVGYMLFSTMEAALENIADLTGEAYEDNFGLETYIEENSHLVAQDNVTGKWGQRRSGLCGFGPFESIEEAIADSSTYGLGGPVVPVIFEGEWVFDSNIDGQDEGVTFRPIRIAEVVRGES